MKPLKLALLICITASLMLMAGCTRTKINKNVEINLNKTIGKDMNNLFKDVKKQSGLYSDILINHIPANIRHMISLIGSGTLLPGIPNNNTNAAVPPSISNPVNVAPAQPIRVVNPVRRVRISQNFRLSEISSLHDRAVNDPGYKYEWDIAYTESNKAWPLVNQKREIKVAVVDTGVDYAHPDLKNRVLTNLGYNFVSNNRNVMDNNGHGTHVAGIIAAQANNGIGISGIAGPLDVKIIPVKVLDKNGEGQSNIIAEGIEYAVNAGADIINLSLGGSGRDANIDRAVQYALSRGVFVVAAAGNDDRNCDYCSPAGDSGVYTVSAITTAYKKAAFSDYGSNVQGAAPGVDIISTVPGGYAAWSGTSMAAPVVSGVAAIVKAEDPALTPSQMSRLLDSAAVDIGNKGRDAMTGYGLVDAYRAIKAIE